MDGDNLTFRFFFRFFAIICVLVLIFYFYFLNDLPNLKDITGYKPNLINEFYASDGTLFAEYGVEKRKLVDFEEIPDHVVNAFVAVEDKRFYQHSGIDLQSVIRALIRNMVKGQVVSGGSTITQQITKNLILSPEKTYTRKIKEAILSYRIENNLSKDEILYLYLNHIYLADGMYGVESASNNYFGKSVKDISIAEAALLAGIPKRPEYYSPRRNFENSIKRQKTVLRIMESEKYITPKQRKIAEQNEIKIKPKKNIESQIAPYFAEFIRKYLENKLGTEEYKKGGYKVFTTLDIELNFAAQWAVRKGIKDLEMRWGRKFILTNLGNQKSIRDYLKFKEGTKIVNKGIYDAVIISTGNKNEKIKSAKLAIGNSEYDINYYVSKPFGTTSNKIKFKYSKKYAPITNYNNINIVPTDLRIGDVIKVKVYTMDNKNFKVYPLYDTKTEAALMSMDTNGDILAMVGGYDFNQSQFNRAIQAKRQPGSSFKPLLYSAAIDKGYTETSVLYDIPITIDDWEPSNYDEKHSGAILLRKAVINSRNLAAVRLILDIGTEYVADYSRNFGFNSTINPFPSLALGGSDVTLFEMMKAYNIFANRGIHREPRFILRIYDRYDRIIEDNTGKRYIKYEKLIKKERENKRFEILKQIAESKGVEIEFETIKQFENIGKIYETEQNFLDSEEFLKLVKKVPTLYFLNIDDDKRIISSETAYIVTDLLQAVVKEGTAIRAARLNEISAIAGKTGTTNDFTDAWFLGYSPNIITGVWVGRDNHTSLGKKEAGSRAALPIWIDFMESSLRKYNKLEKFDKPSGVKYVNTPYGYIPYKIESLKDSLKKDKYEIDFLLKY